jgi:Domain of unknown function (DUF4440)
MLTTIAVVCTIALAPEGACVAKHPQRSDSEEILALEHRYSQAEMTSDVRGMSKLLAEDFTDTDENGTFRNKTDLLNLFESPKVKLKSDSLSEVSIRVYRESAIVTFVDTAEFTVDGNQQGGRFRGTDVWIKRSGDWQMAAEHLSKIR